MNEIMNVNGINVIIARGDIATFKANAYIVPQYRDHCSFTSVAARLICSEYYQAVEAYDIGAKYINYPFGYAVSFETNSQEVERLIHVAVLDLPEDNAFNLTQLATYSVLIEAEKRGIRNLAIPALATGKDAPLKFSASAAAMISALALLPTDGTLQNITIPIWKSEAAYRHFCDGAKKYLPHLRFGLYKDYDVMQQKVMSRR